MLKTPKGMRLHIGIFGRRNVGKSSILNALTRQQVSIVSDVAGTTTDPVEKPMEVLPLGPVLFIDTAGIDDSGALGAERVKRTLLVFDRTELGLIICRADEWGEFEIALVDELEKRKIPILVVFNQADLAQPDATLIAGLESRGLKWVKTVAPEGQGILELKDAIVESVPPEFLLPPSILGDLVTPGKFAVLVVAIDKEAPKGRLILPQVQAIRDLLDNDAYCVVVKDRDQGHDFPTRDEELAAFRLVIHCGSCMLNRRELLTRILRCQGAGVPITNYGIAIAFSLGILPRALSPFPAARDLLP